MEDSAALAQSSDDQKESNSAAATKTGDETPIGLMTSLLAAALVIGLGAIFVLKRRRRS